MRDAIIIHVLMVFNLNAGNIFAHDDVIAYIFPYYRRYIMGIHR